MITIEAAKLSAALKLATGVVEARNKIPILSNVALTMVDGRLSVVSTNMDLEFSQRIDVVSGGEFSTSVDARRFSSLVAAVPNGAQIKLEMDGDRLLVRTGRGQWRLPTLPLDDFPRLTRKDLPSRVEISGKALTSLLASVLWSVSSEETRYYLNGPLLHCEDGALSLAATNGHTLAHVVSEVEWPVDASDAIIAPKFADLLERLCGDVSAKVLIQWDAARIEAQIGSATIIGKAIDGTFPDFRRVIPQEVPAPMVLDPENMAGALKQAMLVHCEKTRAAKLSPRDGRCVVTCTSPDTGSSEFEVPVESSLDFEVGFNGDYLTGALCTVGGGTVELHQADAAAPALIKRAVGDGPRCVVMPMRV